jgi:hypothetical protein
VRPGKAVDLDGIAATLQSVGNLLTSLRAVPASGGIAPGTTVAPASASCPRCAGITDAALADARLLYTIGDTGLTGLARNLRGQRGASLGSLRRRCWRERWVLDRARYRLRLASILVERLRNQPPPDRMRSSFVPPSSREGT